jgi:peptidoglycan LD-endopeptidase CwlK
MSFKLSTRSRGRLIGVHPDLVRVVERAITVTAVDFSVVEGVRTLAAQRRYFQLGKSKTMRSRHLPSSNACGMSCAVDLAPWIDGEINWDDDKFVPVADAMKSSAYALGVPLEWGYDLWRWDSPHFQLPWSAYP